MKLRALAIGAATTLAIAAIPGIAAAAWGTGGWYHLIYNGVAGYASGRYISTTTAFAPPPPPPVYATPRPRAPTWGYYQKPWWDSHYGAWYDGRRWYWNGRWYSHPTFYFGFSFGR
jgi:hypothetical protein